MEGKMPEAYKIREAAKNTLRVAVINKEANKEKLKRVPHAAFADLAVVPIVATSADIPMKMFGNVIPERAMLEGIFENIDKDEDGATKDARVIMTALGNAVKKYPPEITGMREMLLRITEEMPELREEFDELMQEPETRTENEPEMYVATTAGGYMGAGVMVYPGFLEEAAEKVGGSFYIIPSSVHEVVLVQMERKEGMDNGLSGLVHDVNIGMVEEEDRLSDNVYYYDHRSKRLSVYK